MSANPSGVWPLVPGFRLDRYELLCPLATGGMAAIWVARLRAKHGFEKLLAIKTILPEFAADIAFQEMLLDEARIAAAIDHTNVAHVLDLGEEHGVLYLVMECVDGDSVGKLYSAMTTSGSPFPAAVALRIVADACAGLHAAHELSDKDGRTRNVVHRDVSPQNILLSSSGVVKIIDFGIARARDRIADETRTGSIKGKIQFMAPEQATGRPVDRRVDVWAAGAVLYKLLAGRPPFDGPSSYATLHQIASGARPDPLPPEVPREVALVVERALAYDPQQRFPTARAMREALEEAMTATRLQASTNDVALLVETHLSDRTSKRKRDIDNALRDADERDAASGVVSQAKPPKTQQSLAPSATSELLTLRDAQQAVVAPEPTSTAFGLSLSLHPRTTRRFATAALAVVGAAILLTTAMRRAKPLAHPPVTATNIMVAAAEIAPQAPVDPPAQADPPMRPAPVAVKAIDPWPVAQTPVRLVPLTVTKTIDLPPATTRTSDPSPRSSRGSASAQEKQEKKSSGRRSASSAAPKPAPAPPRSESIVDDGF